MPDPAPQPLHPNYPTSPVLQYLYDRYVGDDPEKIASWNKVMERERRKIEKQMSKRKPPRTP